MAGRRVILPMALIAVAVLFCGPSFVGFGASSTSSRARAGDRTLRGALPADFLVDSSVSLAESLEVSTPGWWANIVCLVVPITYLITLYLQSERTKVEMRNRK
ncbi:unnamed protein product [Polarella glacialis]|uniref:Uncharacterized protein n=1 Tax=Polarella glacialis TaxID=89957 RepID=A0A813EC70_POLGL|nr:unnamed protein product [Polarella glacialis]